MSEPFCLACRGSDIEPWAEARDVEYATSDESYAYVRCRNCDALSISPVPRDRLASIYPENYYSFSGEKAGLVERVKQSLDRRMFRRLFRGIGGDSLSVLDVGGGNGWLLSQARSVEPRLTRTVVVDLDGSARAEAERAGHEFVHGRIEEYDTDRKFDLILLLNLIEHVDDPVRVLERMRALLAPGGRILVKTPNHDSLDARLFRHRNWGGYHCPRHWVLFTPESFVRAAGQAGLEACSVRLTQGAPFWTVSVLEMLSRHRLVSISRTRPMCAHALFSPLLGLFAVVDLLRRPFGKTSQMFVQLREAKGA